MKIRPLVAELFHAGGRTDRRDEANARFSLRTRLILKLIIYSFALLFIRYTLCMYIDISSRTINII
jgi:hypothetical protein